MADYVSRRRGAGIIGAPPKQMPRIAEAAGIRRLVLPGLSVRYHRGDLERLARECVIGGPAEVPELAEAGV